MSSVSIARVYEERTDDQGRRVLVDRLWPRGIRKDDPRIDQWLPKIAPSTELRKWYGHDPSKLDDFHRRYEHELASGEAASALDQLRDVAAAGAITLVTATRDVDLSHLPILARML